MYFIKVTRKGVNEFVAESDVQRLTQLKKSFNAEFELDSEVGLKRYSEDDVRTYLGLSTGSASLESLLGFPEKQENSAPNKKPSSVKPTPEQ